MQTLEKSVAKGNCGFPKVLPVRQQAEVIQQVIKKRLKTILPMAMREAGFDMWLILCQEDNLDPVYKTMIPEDCWCPILQILVFYDRGEEEGIEGISISGTRLQDLYERAYTGQLEEQQWPLLMKIIEERDPKRIGINTGSIQWAAGGLTHNLYLQLVEKMPAKYVDRLESAERMATLWLATLTDEEVELYDHVADVAHSIIADCYDREAVVPGVTTLDDLHWYYRQRCADVGIEVPATSPFYLTRSEEMRKKYGADDRVIRAGDFVRSDVQTYYLRLYTDLHEWMYVLRPGENDAPAGMKHLMSEANREQDIFMSEFQLGLTGDELLANILRRARQEGIPNPRIYSHMCGLLMHEPGPLIGLPWEKESCAGRGAVKLGYNYSFAMELSVRGPVPEWGGQEVHLALEEKMIFTEEGCRVADGRQTEFYLI